jgi:hypothetical protein
MFRGASTIFAAKRRCCVTVVPTGPPGARKGGFLLWNFFGRRILINDIIGETPSRPACLSKKLIVRRNHGIFTASRSPKLKLPARK